MKLEYTLPNVLKGGLIYSVGDTIAALISHEYDWIRMLGILLIGATVYAFEIPNYFKWIDKKVAGQKGFKPSMYRGLLAMLYFNPLWIARHILFMRLLMGQYDQLNWSILMVGLISFLINIPISLAANYIIQNVISFKHRFVASAIFSGLMAIYYSLSNHWFG
jgi:hypothetical protein